MADNNYIPAQDGKFNDWAKNVIAQLSGKADDWNIPAAEVGTLTANFTAWTAAWAAYQVPNHGKTDTLNKTGARKTLESAMRAFIKSFLLYNSAVTDADRQTLGIPIHDTTRTPATAPSTKPEAEVKAAVREVFFHFRDANSEKRGKPAGTRCFEMRYQFAAAKPVSIDAFTKTATATKSPLTITVDEENRGGTLWYCMRWEGMKPTLKGPWSEIYSTFIL
jgi:hypothetical protein